MVILNSSNFRALDIFFSRAIYVCVCVCVCACACVCVCFLMALR